MPGPGGCLVLGWCLVGGVPGPMGVCSRSRVSGPGGNWSWGGAWSRGGAWFGAIPPGWLLLRAIRILLECVLVH